MGGSVTGDTRDQFFPVGVECREYGAELLRQTGITTEFDPALEDLVLLALLQGCPGEVEGCTANPAICLVAFTRIELYLATGIRHKEQCYAPLAHIDRNALAMQAGKPFATDRVEREQAIDRLLDANQCGAACFHVRA